MNDAIHPHPFAFPDATLDDLRERLARTRWPERETVDDWSQGAPLARMQALCDHWRKGYDWRAAEARLNALDPSMTRIRRTRYPLSPPALAGARCGATGDNAWLARVSFRIPEGRAAARRSALSWRRSEGRLPRRSAHAAQLRPIREAGAARLDARADCQTDSRLNSPKTVASSTASMPQRLSALPKAKFTSAMSSAAKWCW